MSCFLIYILRYISTDTERGLMPPKQKITKEMLLEYAFKITEESGIDAVTEEMYLKKQD